MYLKKGGRILFVEDETALRDVMAAELRDAGYEVVEAENGVTAIIALAKDFDLLLTDIRMSGQVNGWDLAEAARRIQPDIGVIYMTGYATTTPKRVDRSLFITKPCTVSQILAVVACCAGGEDMCADPIH